MKQNPHRIARAVQWLGWDSSTPSVAAVFADDAVWMLALRDRPLRVTACGAVPLSVGTVRNGELRLVGLAADALRTLRDHLLLPADSALTLVVDPLDARVDIDVDADGDRVVATVDRRRIEALSRCAEEADAPTVRFDPVPAAIARLGRHVQAVPDEPLFVGGAGWMWASPGADPEVVPIGSITDPVSIGSTPSSLVPVSRPTPVRVVSNVELDGPWQVLVGAALADFEFGPAAIVESREQAATFGWAAERIAGMVR